MSSLRSFRAVIFSVVLVKEDAAFLRWWFVSLL